MIDPKVKKLINKHADRANISYEEAEAIWSSLGKIVKKVISEGDILEGESTYKSVYIKDLGIIHPNKKKIFKVREAIIKKLEHENIQSEG